MSLDELRAALKLASVSEISRLSGLSRMTINRVQRGVTNPNMGTYERLVKALKGEASPTKVRKQK